MNAAFRKNLLRLKDETASGRQVFGIFSSAALSEPSTLMYNSTFSKKNINAVYIPFNVDNKDLSRALPLVREAGMTGLNTDLSLSNSVIDVIDSVVPAAKKTGVVSAIQFLEGTMRGHNTYADGFSLPLKSFVEAIKYESVVIIGGGLLDGSVLFSILQNFPFPYVTLISDDEHAGNELLDKAEYWRKHAATLEYININDTKTAAEYIWESRLIVTCRHETLSENTGVISPKLVRFFRPGQVAYETNLIPYTTSFIREAEKRGAHIIRGLQLFLQHGYRSLQIWTKKKMQISKIEPIVLESLADFE